jgi:hypothetical protein
MIEGWHGEDYLILFAESEISAVSERYSMSQLLPGYQVQGLRGWDDFIVRDVNGQTYSIPTLPVDAKFMRPFPISEAMLTLQPDDRFLGKIKWYLKPLVLGGDANPGENLSWVSHEQHAQLVKWWNDRYRSLRVQTAFN